MKCNKCNNIISQEYFEVIIVRYIGKTGRRISEKRYCPSCFDKFGAIPTDSKKSSESAETSPEISKDDSVTVNKV